MKKGLFLLILMMVFIPLNVLGASASVSLDCTDKIKKGGTVSCNVVANITPTAQETVSSFIGNVDVEADQFAAGTTLNKTGLTATGSNQILATFTLAVNSDAVEGDTTVTLNITEMKDNSDGSVTLSSSTVIDTIKILNNNTAIKSILANGNDGSCTLTAKDCTLPSVKGSTITIAATPVDSKATITGTGTKTLKCGNNNMILTVMAEDKETKLSYTLNVNRTCNTDTTLKNITVSSGSLNPTFAGSSKTYAVTVTTEIDKITISAEKNDTTQKVEGTIKDKALAYGENKFTLTVTSESGVKGTYTITVTREDGRDTNTYLSTLEVSSGKLAFDKEITEYKVRVLHEVETMKIEAKAEAETSKVTITNNNLKLVDGINKDILITVTSEQGVNKIYKVTVERLKEGETLGDNPNLSNIKVDGYDLGFNSNKTEYTLKIDKEDKLIITTEVEEIGTEVQIKGNNNLKNGDVITITSTSADGTTKDYKIVIEKSNLLPYIIVAGVIGVALIALIIILIIKNRKKKDQFGTDELKNQLKEEELLKQASNEIIEKNVNSYGPTTPLSINGTGINNTFRDNYQSANEQISKSLPPRVSPLEDKIERPVVLEDTDATKVCSICGHRVAASLKTCPYCKRSF